MFKAYGLYGHIRANRVRSVILLLGFVALLHALQFSFLLIINALRWGGAFEDIVAVSVYEFWKTWPFAAIAALAWFAVAYGFHGTLIRTATGARSVTRTEAPALYNALETLCISRGITMPALEIIESPSLNAYAAGINAETYAIAVTRGMLERLSPGELEAVLAHELTHIRNRDTQMMIIAVIFAGIFAFFGDLAVRRWDFPYGWSPRDKPTGGGDEWRAGESSTRGRGRDGGGAVLAILLAIAIIVISWGISTLIRFALSRSREYLADAGSVELTKNPDAMISALRKIENNAAMDVVSRTEALFIENPVRARVSGILATHPSVDERVAAIKAFAGGQDVTTSAV